MTVSHRLAEPDDIQFVVSAWSRGFKDSDHAGVVDAARWESVMHTEIQRMTNRHGTRTIVAYEKRDPTFLYGFITGDTTGSIPVVDFVYVKKAYREAGYARGLFAALGVSPIEPFYFTCYTWMVDVLKAKIPAARHDPKFARYSNYEPNTRSDLWRR